MLHAISNSPSRNLIEFNNHGFDCAFDHNMSQIIEIFTEEMKELYTAIISDTRTVVNESNLDSLLDFSGKSFSEKQKTFGLKFDSFNIQPLDYSTKDIDTLTELMPGANPIYHFYKLDGCIKFPRQVGDLLYSLLKIYIMLKDKNDEEIVEELMKRKIFDACIDNIIPMTYCMPMNAKKVDQSNDLEYLYKSPIINVYTHIDKDELYRSISLYLFETYKYEIKKEEFNLSNFKEFYRSIAAIMLTILNKPCVKSELITSCLISKCIHGAIYRSTLGSISKFYDNVPVTGARYFIIDELKRICKTRRTSETWSNRHYNSKNPTDVIYGSRGMDYILNYTIAEILSKKLYDKVTDRDGGIFEFIISNSLAYVLTTASLCIGDSESVKKIQDITSIDIKNEEIVTEDFMYLDKAFKDFSVYTNDFLDKLITIAYGAFMIKHVYDVREVVKGNNSSFTSSEYNFVSGIIGTGVDYICQNINSLEEIMEEFDITIKNDDYNYPIACEPRVEKSSKDPEDMNSIINPNGIFDSFKHAISRLLAITPLLRICKNLRSIRRNTHTISEKGLRNPTFGDKDHSSESVNIVSQVYSSEDLNLLKSFVGKERLTGTIPEYCKQLKIDTIVGIESSNDEILGNCIRKMMVINNIKSRNPSPENVKCIDDTLNYVAAKFVTIQ